MLFAFVVGTIAIFALIFAFVLRRQVLAYETGTPAMEEVAGAVQEGSSAYLSRQLRTRVSFVVIVFELLFLLPGDAGIKTRRAILFVVDAAYTAGIGCL